MATYGSETISSEYGQSSIHRDKGWIIPLQAFGCGCQAADTNSLSGFVCAIFSLSMSVVPALYVLLSCYLHVVHLRLRECKVQGPSMLPTMNVSNEIVMEDTLSPRLSSSWINRGHLVSLLSPLEPTRPVCKRVIGLPGDTICVYPDKASMYRSAALSGGKDYERQNDVPVEKEPQHVIVPEGHIWISGDNIPFSRDSSVYGPVPIALVRGKIFARVRPHDRNHISALI